MITTVAKPVLQVLRLALDHLAEADHRYRDERRLKEVSDDTLRDIGLTRGQLESAARHRATSHHRPRPGEQIGGVATTTAP